MVDLSHYLADNTSPLKSLTPREWRSFVLAVLLLAVETKKGFRNRAPALLQAELQQVLPNLEHILGAGFLASQNIFFPRQVLVSPWVAKPKRGHCVVGWSPKRRQRFLLDFCFKPLFVCVMLAVPAAKCQQRNASFCIRLHSGRQDEKKEWLHYARGSVIFLHPNLSVLSRIYLLI